MRQAKQLAANLVRTFRGQPTRPFSFKNLGMLASLGNRSAVAEYYRSTHIRIFCLGFMAGYLPRQASQPGEKAGGRGRLVMEFVVFSQHRAISNVARGGVGLAHYAPGEFVFHKGDPAGNVFAIESGTAGVYLDESAQPVSILKPGEPFGEVSAGNGRRIHPYR